ncbi:MAG: chorismate-binding protein, partial [Clostridia bacterium]|nr:chorismate-binding protein [Clostridia bacterium]
MGSFICSYSDQYCFRILSYALAGTLPKTGQEGEAQRLLQDDKNNYEHQIVVEEIRRKMQTITPQVQVGSTEILELKNLYHLKTEIIAEDSNLSLDKWAELLHPTPAMGGKPQDLALQIIEQFEGYDRGLYAAPIGYTDAQGEGLFVVGIRSVLMVGNKLYAYAGCGI